MTQTLDPVTVVGGETGYTGDSLGFDPHAGTSHASTREYCESPEYTAACIKHLFAKLPNTDAIATALAEYSAIDRYWKWHQIKNNPIFVYDAIRNHGDDQQGHLLDTQFSGASTMPMAALYHYLRGNGAPRELSILDLRLMHFSAADIPPVQNKTDNPSIPNGTTVFIDEQYSRNTKNDSPISRWTVGNITLRVAGELTIHVDGSYHFQGELRSFADVYDGGVHTDARDDVDNWLTSLLNVLETVGGTPYDIGITGALPVSFDGQRPR